MKMDHCKNKLCCFNHILGYLSFKGITFYEAIAFEQIYLKGYTL